MHHCSSSSSENSKQKGGGRGGGREEGRERINLELYWNNGEREIGRGRKKNWKTTWFSGGTRGARKHEGKKKCSWNWKVEKWKEAKEIAEKGKWTRLDSNKKPPPWHSLFHLLYLTRFRSSRRGTEWIILEYSTTTMTTTTTLFGGRPSSKVHPLFVNLLFRRRGITR